jgi:hypothetical protein
MNLFDQDHTFLQEALPQLQEYLLSNELYWPLGRSLPRLTPGSLLLALAREQGLAPGKELDTLRMQLESLRQKWRSAWDKKAAREIVNRMRLWSDFLSDYASAPDQNMESYTTEARVRVILQLLFRELPNAPEKTALNDLDALLKSHLIPAEFIWEPELQTVFPKADFWFLYGKLR